MSAKRIVPVALSLALVLGLADSSRAVEPLKNWSPDAALVDAAVADALADRNSQTVHLRFGWGWPGYYGYGYGAYRPYFGVGYYSSYYPYAGFSGLYGGYGGYSGLYDTYYGNIYSPPLAYSYYYPAYTPTYYSYTSYRPIYAGPRRCCGLGGCYYW